MRSLTIDIVKQTVKLKNFLCESERSKLLQRQFIIKF